MSAARDAEVSVMRSLQSELRRSACFMHLHIVSAPLAAFCCESHAYITLACFDVVPAKCPDLIMLVQSDAKSQPQSNVIIVMKHSHRIAVRVSLPNTSHSSVDSSVTVKTKDIQLPHAGSMLWSACA